MLKRAYVLLKRADVHYYISNNTVSASCSSNIDNVIYSHQWVTLLPGSFSESTTLCLKTDPNMNILFIVSARPDEDSENSN